MDQRTHTWLAIRAVALLDDANETPGLVKILKPHVKSAAIGSWIPDMADSKRGTGDIDNHVFKLKPYSGAGEKRFITKRDKLFESLGNKRLIRTFLDNWDGVLGADWWNKPYKADPAPGQHLANRSMALTTTLIDQLILGDTNLAKLVPGEVKFAKNLHPAARSRGEQVATYFFMLSHFVADACQPCHSDARRLSAYGNGLHKEMEGHWSKKVGTYFKKKKLLETSDTPAKILKAARAVDGQFNLTFENKVPKILARDTWLEVVTLCRASFAVASILAPPQSFPYDANNLTTFNEVFLSDNADTDLLPDLNQAIAHDAVLNIAMVWKEVWRTFD
jgi:hypothetical protein